MTRPLITESLPTTRLTTLKETYEQADASKESGLQERIDIPLIGIISRLVAQKGFDLIDYVMDEILKMDIQFVLLGAGEYSMNKCSGIIRKSIRVKFL